MPALLPAAALCLMLAACATDPQPRDTTAKAPAASPQPARPGPAPKPAPASARAGRGVLLCKMAVTNPPATDSNGAVAAPDARLRIDGAALLIAPVTDGCLSSGFGPRNGRAHKGIDYFTRSGAAIAAGDGVIREKVVRADFGNMILIEHGPGVFTRYAHLASFAPSLKEGDKIRSGARLGPVGATGAAGAAHLHYEVLTGAYVKGAGSFGLKAIDPFTKL